MYLCFRGFSARQSLCFFRMAAAFFHRGPHLQRISARWSPCSCGFSDREFAAASFLSESLPLPIFQFATVVFPSELLLWALHQRICCGALHWRVATRGILWAGWFASADAICKSLPLQRTVCPLEKVAIAVEFLTPSAEEWPPWRKMPTARGKAQVRFQSSVADSIHFRAATSLPCP